MSVRFAGYAAVFDRVDSGGDVVRAGAFGPRLGAVPLLWEHRAGAAIGLVEQVAEDRRGLRVIGRVTDARVARALSAGVLDGLSFGYRIKRASNSQPRELTGLELVEVSLVAFPMQPAARVHAITPVLRDDDRVNHAPHGSGSSGGRSDPIISATLSPSSG